MRTTTETANAITATDAAPKAHRIGNMANHRRVCASAACRTDARCAGVSKSTGASSRASANATDAVLRSSTSARASSDDSRRRSTASDSALSSSPSTYAVHFGSFGLIRVITGSCRVLAQVAADRAHCFMKKEAHVARGECSDRRDFLVAQATLKLEVDDFTLIAGECLEDVEDAAECLTRVVLPVEVVHHRRF